VPFAPGGSADINSRLIALKMSELLGQQIIVDNRAGASGNIGNEMAARAAPDGYTLLLNTRQPVAPTGGHQPQALAGISADPDSACKRTAGLRIRHLVCAAGTGENAARRDCAKALVLAGHLA
jgi:hypothetical protein